MKAEKEEEEVGSGEGGGGENPKQVRSINFSSENTYTTTMSVSKRVQ